MITKIFAQGFKGLDFEQPLAARTLITGKVGSGKSARVLALTLLVTGSVPGTGIAKRGGDILDTLGSGDSLSVGLELDDGTTLERTFKRNKRGAATQSYRVMGDSVPKGQFELTLASSGVRIVDLPGFLSMSGSKKVDEIFRLFPPQGDIAKINRQIEDAKAKASEEKDRLKGLDQSIEGLTTQLANMQLPATTLPQVKDDLAKVESDLEATLREQAEEDGRLKAEAEAARTAKAEAEARAKEATTTAAATTETAPATAATTRQQPNQVASQVSPGKVGGGNGTAPAGASKDVLSDPRYTLLESHASQDTPRPGAGTAALASLEKVKAMMEKSGCTECPALMVLKREIRNMKAAS